MRQLSKLLLPAFLSAAILLSLFSGMIFAKDASERVPALSASDSASFQQAGVTAFASLSDFGVSVRWQPAANANRYLIKRSNEQGGPYSLVGTVSSATYGRSVTESVYAFTDQGPFDRALYRYVVSAVGPRGESGTSAELVVLLPPVMGSVQPVGQTIQIAWPSVNGASSFHVKRADAPGGPYETIHSVSVAEDPNAKDYVYSDQNVQPGTTYYYVLSTVTEMGESPNSGELSAAIQSQASINLLAFNDFGGVTLHWTSVKAANSYTVLRSTDFGGPYVTIASGIQGTTFTDTGVQPGVTYEYVVTVVRPDNGIGKSNTAWSSIPLPNKPGQH